MLLLENTSFWVAVATIAQTVIASIALIISIASLLQSKKIKELTAIVAELARQTEQLKNLTSELSDQAAQFADQTDELKKQTIIYQNRFEIES